MLKVEVIGNLGSDAEIKEINGKKYMSFSVAHSDRRTDANGTVTERTTWVSVLRNGDGGNLLQYLKKGCKVYVRGALFAKTYSDQRGAVCVALNVNADEIQLCGLKPSEQGAGVDWDKGGDDLPY